ncbi:MAG: flagellar basal-body rod protein FlgG [Deltaproteobacteria bacterium]|nr:flagellar basal-body rod protein FlgG [Deltaproteobacteria bacterium]
MIKALFTAATGMEAQQTRIAVISNNLSNMNTTGFKASRAEFEDLIYETRSLPGGQSASGLSTPGGIQIGSGVAVVSTPSQFSQGTLEQTGGALDVAIEGDGFFGVTLPNGTTGYTRAGSLAIDSTGKLVTQSGLPISPAITLNTAAVDRKIGADGTITSRIPPASTTTSEGTLTLYSFANPGGLQAVGKNTFQETTASGTPTSGTPGTSSLGTLQQGFLESSNVNIAEELIRMIMAQRGYELNGKVISTADQMLNSTNQLR